MGVEGGGGRGEGNEKGGGRGVWSGFIYRDGFQQFFFSSKSKKCVWDTNMTDSVARCSLRVKFLGGLRFTFFSSFFVY